VTPAHAQQLAVSEVAFGNAQPLMPPPSRPLEKPSRALRSPRSQELWELAGDGKSIRTRTDEHRKKLRGHAVVRRVEKCSMEASRQYSDDAGQGRRASCLAFSGPLQNLGHMVCEAGLAWVLAPEATMEVGREGGK